MFTLKMNGFDRFEEQLQFLKRQFPEELEKFLISIGKSVEKGVNKRTPVKTHNLKDSWHVTNVERDGDVLFIKIYNDAMTEYEGRIVPLAAFVEYGHEIKTKSGEVTGKVDGYYMFTVSIKNAKRQIPRRLKKVFDDLVNRL